MTLDQPWKIAVLIAVLAFLRILWGLWHSAPARRFMVELLDSGLIAFVLVFLLIRPFVVQAFWIPSGSMSPTLLPGDRILVNKFVYRLGEPKRGDIVVFDAPPQALQGPEKRDFVKRLIGLPGDEIQIRRYEGVYVNGHLLKEPAGIPLPDYDWPVDDLGLPARPYRVPQGCYFVLGDNRVDSNDAHRWHDPVTGESRPELEASRVLGKAMVVFWPPTRIGLVGDHRDLKLAPETSLAQARVGHEAPAR